MELQIGKNLNPDLVLQIQKMECFGDETFHDMEHPDCIGCSDNKSCAEAVRLSTKGGIMAEPSVKKKTGTASRKGSTTKSKAKAKVKPKAKTSANGDYLAALGETLAELGEDITVKVGSTTVSLRHEKVKGNVLGIAGSEKTLLFASQFLKPGKDKGCELTGKQYATVKFKDPTPEEILEIGTKVLKRAGISA